MVALTERISVVLPAYNEERRIGLCVRETLKSLQGLIHEVVVVDDGSTDGTRREALLAAEGNSCVKVVGYERNQGKGYALKFGFGHTTGDIVAFLDADLQIHPRQLRALYELMQESCADVVIGCKRHPESRVEYSLVRYLVSTGYLLLTRWLFGLGLRDTQTGIKLFRREVLERVWPRVSIKRFAFDLALLVGATRFNYCIVEAPVEISSQYRKRDRTSILAIVQTLLDTLVIFYEASFWKWLAPGLAVKGWLLAFVLGLVAFSFGIAHLLTFIHLPEPLARTSYYLALQFMDKQARDWLLVGIGAVVVIAALVQLNKYVLAAFARADSGDLASITRLRGSWPPVDEARSGDAGKELADQSDGQDGLVRC